MTTSYVRDLIVIINIIISDQRDILSYVQSSLDKSLELHSELIRLGKALRLDTDTETD